MLVWYAFSLEEILSRNLTGLLLYTFAYHIYNLINVQNLRKYIISTKVRSGMYDKYVETPTNLYNEFAQVKCLQSVRKNSLRSCGKIPTTHR